MSANTQSFFPGLYTAGPKNRGIATVVGNNSSLGSIVGTDADDIISIRTGLENSTTTLAKGGNDTIILYGSEMLPTGNYHDMLESLKNAPNKTAKEYFGQSRAHTIRLGSSDSESANSISLISELGATPEIIDKHTGADGRVDGRGVAGENDQPLDHWAGVFGFVNVVDFDPTQDTLEFRGHTTVLGESFTKNGHFYQTVYSEQNANDQSGPRAGAAHDDTFLGLIQFKDGAAAANAIADTFDVSAMEHYVVEGTGEQVFEADVTSNRTGEQLFEGKSDNEGAAFVLGNDSTVQRVVGTQGDDIISLRPEMGENLTAVTRQGDDSVILYGADMLPTGNYHEMLDDLKQKPFKTAKDYFGQSSPHTIRLGTGEDNGADTISLISELDATPEIIAKHTGDDGKVNGRGVAGENDQPLDHWAGVFGFVNIANFDPTEDSLDLLGHTITLGESFTKNGHFFQTVYSEQNANDQSGPRAGAAHDDTFLGLIRFNQGAANAEAIADAIDVSAMEHYVVDGTGEQVFEGDPTSNQTRPTIDYGPLMTFALADAQTDEIVSGYENLGDASQIDLNGLDLEKYTLVAQVNPNHPDAERVESVKFESDLGNRTENVKPYALFGDRGGNFSGKALETGDFTVKATAYSQDGGKGQAIGSVGLDYTVVDSTPEAAPAPASESNDGQSLMTFALVDAATDQIVEAFQDLGTKGTLNLEGLDLDKYSIMAQINADHPDAQRVQSVTFESDLGNRTENVKPYALFGDRGGDFSGRMLETGDFTLKATAYTRDGGKGQAIGAADLAYSVVDGVVGANQGVGTEDASLMAAANQPADTAYSLADMDTSMSMLSDMGGAGELEMANGTLGASAYGAQPLNGDLFSNDDMTPLVAVQSSETLAGL